MMKNQCNHKDIRICRDCSQRSRYCWFNIERSKDRVGKIRSFIDGNRMTIHSITVFPEFERQGIAKATITMLKQKYTEIIADRVRPKAVRFWQKMEFKKEQGGNYIWTR